MCIVGTHIGPDRVSLLSISSMCQPDPPNLAENGRLVEYPVLLQSNFVQRGGRGGGGDEIMREAPDYRIFKVIPLNVVTR
jgi:hypothetical protein